MTGISFVYTPIPPFSGGMPILNVRLSHDERDMFVPALVDSGAALNILPYDYGLELGFVWEKQRLPLPVGGFMKGADAYAVLVQTRIDPFPPVDLAFAWVEKSSDEVRTLLGQVNFFRFFRVVFEGYHNAFEIAPHETS